MKKLIALLSCCVFLLAFLPLNVAGQIVIARQGFESSGETWPIVSGNPNIASASGSSDTPSSQRIRSGSASWQVNNSTATLELGNISTAGQSNVTLVLNLSSPSVTGTNGSDATDSVRIFVALNGSAFSAAATVTLHGNNNSRWGYTALLTAAGSVGTYTRYQAPQGGTNTNNYSRVEITIPDGTTSVALRIVALNNSVDEIWCVDDVVLGAAAANDLAIQGMSVDPPFPTALTPFTIRSRVRNLGLQPATGYSLNFYYDANGNSLADTSELFSTQVGSALGAGDSAVISATYPSLQAGNHRFITTLSYSLDQIATNDTLSIVVPVSHAPGAVLINEIMYAPSLDEPEWLEFFNPTTDTINLRNWRISDNNVATKTVMSTTDFKIAPGNYAIVAKDANFSTVHPTVTVPIAIANFSALNNTTPDAVVLYDNRLATMDSVLYAPSWGGQGGKSLERIDSEAPSISQTNWTTSLDSLGRTPGRENSVARRQIDLAVGEVIVTTVGEIGGQRVPAIVYEIRNIGKQTVPAGFSVTLHADTNKNGQFESTELIHEHVSTFPLPANAIDPRVFEWGNAPSGETPLRVAIVLSSDQRQSNNTQTVTVRRRYESKALIVNEIMYDPFAGQNEWVEFLHRGSAPIDLARWQFSDRPTLSGNFNTFTMATSSRVIQPGDYVVAAADSTILSSFPLLATPSQGIHVFILNRSSGFSLGNDGDDVVLRDHTGATIDSVSYSPKWNHPDISDTKGRSLERINPNLDSNDPRNWSTATPITGGTPGGTNSIFTSSRPSGASISISPNPFSPDGDGHEDFCIVRYNLPTTTSLIRVRIFDIKGRMLRTLANLEPSGAKGELIWDGLDDTRQRVRIGMYVLLIEAADSQSQTVASTRAVVVVATRL